MIKNCFDRLRSYVVDGQLLEDYVLDNVKALLECLRDSNVTIRWLMLHNNCTSPAFKESIQKAYDKNSLVTFILQLAKFENQFETMIRRLVQQKGKIWEDDREQSYKMLYEVSEYFAGNRNWDMGGQTDQQQAAQMCEWFKDVSEQIQGLDYKKSNKTGV